MQWRAKCCAALFVCVPVAVAFVPATPLLPLRGEAQIASRPPVRAGNARTRPIQIVMQAGSGRSGSGGQESKNEWEDSLDTLDTGATASGQMVLLESERGRADDSDVRNVFDPSVVGSLSDSKISTRLTAVYRELLPESATILDLGSAWASPLVAVCLFYRLILDRSQLVRNRLGLG